MQTIGILGAGTMGGGIAHLAALCGFDVFLYDLSAEILNEAQQRIISDLLKGVERQKLTREQARKAQQRISLRPALEDFSGCETIIEAVVERIDVKQDLFKRLESVCPPTTIFASNTSSFSITAIATGLKYQDRVAGMHFFNPPLLMKLVEVVRGRRTSDGTITKTVQLAKSLGKTPVLAKDSPGFIVNRIARPFYGESLRILGEGVSTVEEIDRIVRLEGGFKMGPFELMDLIGIDVNFAVTKSMYEQTFGEPRYRPHVIQQSMVDAGLLGRKTKRGFYTYEQ